MNPHILHCLLKFRLPSFITFRSFPPPTCQASASFLRALIHSFPVSHSYTQQPDSPFRNAMGWINFLSSTQIWPCSIWLFPTGLSTPPGIWKCLWLFPKMPDALPANKLGLRSLQSLSQSPRSYPIILYFFTTLAAGSRLHVTI